MLLNTSNSPNTTLSARITGALTIAGGAAFAALAALEITHPHIHAIAVKTPAEHAILALFAAGMLLIAPAFFSLAEFGSRVAPAKAAASGLVLLAIGSTYANVRGGDPGWFNALAGVTNLLWLGCSIWLAFNLYRNSNLHKAIPLMLPISWATTIVGARIGGGAVSGLYWVVVGVTLVSMGRTIRTFRAPWALLILCALVLGGLA
ncbi:MAG TPA: hypothetical protein VJ454_03090, partial [Steroidobacteraceae bacterium]|nr:hypothetical protein [Steroidobacteraceae bacterium]